MGLIDRQSAIDAVNNAFDRETLLNGFVRSIAVRAIRDMPSAEPTLKEAVSVIRDFLNRGEFIATSTFKTEDGKILKTD